MRTGIVTTEIVTTGIVATEIEACHAPLGRVPTFPPSATITRSPQRFRDSCEGVGASPLPTLITPAPRSDSGGSCSNSRVSENSSLKVNNLPQMLPSFIGFLLLSLLVLRIARRMPCLFPCGLSPS